MAKIAFLFPGQGAQYVGMGKALYDSLPAAKAIFDKADEILGFSLTSLCFDGPEEQLNSTEISQPALFVSSLAALESLKATNPECVASCAATAGLSLGEYTALVFAGVMSFEDALRVVQRRGQAMQEAADRTSGGMVSLLGAELDAVKAVCDEVRGNNILEIANLLCPGNTVVSGESAACARLVEKVNENAIARPTPLTVAGAFHTEIMRPADDRLAEALKDVPMQAPRIPVLSNVDAAAHTDPEEIRALLVKQVISPVLWETSMRQLLADGCDQFYEIGPGKVLRGLLRRIDRKIACENIEC